MVKGVLARALLVAVLALTLPTAALTQDDDLAPQSLEALALQFQVQQTQIDRLDDRIDNVRIGTIRDRLKALEAAVQALASSPPAAASGGRFDAAEQVLVKGIPNGIRSTCSPLRSGLPSGTVAAVRCQPSRNVVDEMAYYLMEYPAAERTFTSVMGRNSVPGPGRRDCSFGRPTQVVASPYYAAGCFVEGGQANVRVVTWAHEDCRQIDVAGTRLREPVVYVALESGGRDIEPLWRFALKPDENAVVDIWRHIPQSGTPAARACRSLVP